MAKNTERIYVGEEMIPGAFNANIMARAFNTKELKSIWESYKAVRKSVRQLRPPTPLEIKMAEMRRTNPVKEIEKKFGMRKDQVYSAIHRVALWSFLNPKN